ncbi:hypothetical protein [Streptomyces sp. NBC_00690]|uniref:hypothetical protein n=1 Tax=Streptomyces sp. NBC_00690 TaxID=2975808 RepID=UPI002E2D3E16|nr:hypothetical protein [Streptomyces sp. NBC_00690]
MWNALARLRSTHNDPVLGLKPSILPAGVLSFVQASDVIISSRIQLTGTQTTSDLHDMISTATRGISWDARTLGPDIALDIMVGRRHDLALHKDHLTGLTQLLVDAAATIGRPGTATSGRCCHCGGTGNARPLWGAPAQ